MEISLAAEMSHIEDLVQCLNKQTVDPHCLPAASEQVIKDLKGIDYSTIVAFKVRPSIRDKKKKDEDWVMFSSFRHHHHLRVH